MRKKLAPLIAGIALLILVDFFVKYLVVNFGSGYQINTGIGLGLFNNLTAGASSGIILNLAGLILILLLTPNFLHKTELVWLFIAILFWAGGLGNLLDRFIYGGVIDYIRFFNISLFNLADVYVALALILLLLQLLLTKKKHVGL